MTDPIDWTIRQMLCKPRDRVRAEWLPTPRPDLSGAVADALGPPRTVSEIAELAGADVRSTRKWLDAMVKRGEATVQGRYARTYQRV